MKAAGWGLIVVHRFQTWLAKNDQWCMLLSFNNVFADTHVVGICQQADLILAVCHAHPIS